MALTLCKEFGAQPQIMQALLLLPTGIIEAVGVVIGEVLLSINPCPNLYRPNKIV